MAEPNQDFLSYLSAISSTNQGLDRLWSGTIARQASSQLKMELDSMLNRTTYPTGRPLMPTETHERRLMGGLSAGAGRDAGALGNIATGPAFNDPNWVTNKTMRSPQGPEDAARALSDFGHEPMDQRRGHQVNEMLRMLSDNYFNEKAVGAESAQHEKMMNNLTESFLGATDATQEASQQAGQVRGQ